MRPSSTATIARPLCLSIPLLLLAACAREAVSLGTGDEGLENGRTSGPQAPGAAGVPPAGVAPHDAAANPNSGGPVVLPVPVVPPIPPTVPPTVPTPPTGGGPAEGCPQWCVQLSLEHAMAIERGMRCTPGQPDQCKLRVPNALSCYGCLTWVNDDTEISAVAARLMRDCPGCLDGRPPGTCSTCSAPGIPVCVPSASSPRGYCTRTVNGVCPAGAAHGAPCEPLGYYCSRSGAPDCNCIGNPPVWSCRSNAPPPAAGP